jgi:hypothetical protein
VNSGIGIVNTKIGIVNAWIGIVNTVFLPSPTERGAIDRS